MRQVTVGLVLGAVLLVGGCKFADLMRRDQDGGKVADPPPPEASQLVGYLNDNSRRVQAVRCDDVAMDCKQADQSVSLSGKLVCRKPLEFRLKGVVVGKPAVDIGSNNDEFWYWISEDKPVPYVYHCRYDDLKRGGVQLPFPFHPDMVVAALGIADYDPRKEYKLEVNDRDHTLELSEAALSPQGQPLTRVTVFNRRRSEGNKPQVLAHVLKDAKGQTVCMARVHEVQVNRETGAILPTYVSLSWPTQKIEMTMRLYNLQAVAIDDAKAARMFNRSDLNKLPSFDLAQGRPDNPDGLQRVRGAAP
jgi:hypothetical protein